MTSHGLRKPRRSRAATRDYRPEPKGQDVRAARSPQLARRSMEQHRGFSPVGRAELGASVRNVTRDRVRTEEELFADLLVRETVRREAQHLDLSLAQSVRWALICLGSGLTDLVSTLRQSRQDLPRVRRTDATESVDGGEAGLGRSHRIIDVFGDQLCRDVWSIGGERKL